MKANLSRIFPVAATFRVVVSYDQHVKEYETHQLLTSLARSATSAPHGLIRN